MKSGKIGIVSIQNKHVDVVANSAPNNCDEVHLGNQMATTFNDAFQACDVAIDESMKEVRDLNRQDVFNFHDNIDIEGGNVEGAYETSQANVLKIELDDLHYLKLATKSKVPLYEGSDLSKLITTLMILNTCTTHHCTDGFVNELLSLLRNSIFPKPNNLPKSHYEAKTLIQNLGLGHISIHACQNGCVLYQNEHEAANQCPICGEC
jgi:hypothetical protein